MRPGQAKPTEYLDNRATTGPLNDAESYYTGQQREWLGAWLRTCADQMLLQHWTLRLWHEGPDTDAHAQVNIIDGRVFASFRFDNEIFDSDPQDARLHMAHELSHVLLDANLQMVEHDLKGALADQAHTLFIRAFRRQIEITADHLANVIASQLPMPPWTSAPADVRTAKSNLTAQERQQFEAEQRAQAERERQALVPATAAGTAVAHWTGLPNSQTFTSGTHPPDAEQPPAE